MGQSLEDRVAQLERLRLILTESVERLELRVAQLEHRQRSLKSNFVALTIGWLIGLLIGFKWASR